MWYFFDSKRLIDCMFGDQTKVKIFIFLPVAVVETDLQPYKTIFKADARVEDFKI
jgi:hypothetical protein